MESVTGKKNSSGSSNLLAPGFRFHPTDEELVRYYLRRKVCGKGFRVDAISEIDIYKAEPWDLPSMHRLSTLFDDCIWFCLNCCLDISRFGWGYLKSVGLLGERALSLLILC